MTEPSIPELGHFALALAVAFGFAQAVLPLWGAHRRDARLIAAAPAIAIGQFVALVASFLCLVTSAVTDDFSVKNIAENSHTLKPLLYKITGVWGDHEGSILLWCLILACCGAAVAAFGTRLPSALRARVLGVMGLSSCGFQLFCLLESNPFVRLWPPPINGRDMNPLLQDLGLAIHPPILYLGYVGFSIPFAFAVAALIEGRVDAAWGRWVRPWALTAWCFLTGGIALGSWWAYYELGWGGFWFWDPVENASLLPWLTGTALLHSAIVVEKREALRVWTVLLAIGTFSLSLSGTFLVRSGILNSVHAFAQDPARGRVHPGIAGAGDRRLAAAVRAAGAGAGRVGHFRADLARGRPGAEQHSVVLDRRGGADRDHVPAFCRSLAGSKIFRRERRSSTPRCCRSRSRGSPPCPWDRCCPGSAPSLAPALSRLWWAALAALAIGLAASLRARLLPAIAFAAAAWLILGRSPTSRRGRRCSGFPLTTALRGSAGCGAERLAPPSPMPGSA